MSASARNRPTGDRLDIAFAQLLVIQASKSSARIVRQELAEYERIAIKNGSVVAGLYHDEQVPAAEATQGSRVILGGSNVGS